MYLYTYTRDTFDNLQGFHHQHWNEAKNLLENGETCKAAFHIVMAGFEYIPLLSHVISVIELVCRNIFQCCSCASREDAVLDNSRVTAVPVPPVANSVSSAVCLLPINQERRDADLINWCMNQIEEIINKNLELEIPHLKESASANLVSLKDTLTNRLTGASDYVKKSLARQLIQLHLLPNVIYCVKAKQLPLLIEALKEKVNKEIGDAEIRANNFASNANSGLYVKDEGTEIFVAFQESRQFKEQYNENNLYLENLNRLKKELQFA